MSAVDDALAELKKAEELLAAAQAVDASTLPKAEGSTTADAAPVTAPAVAAVTEGKRGPMIKNGKLYPSVR